MRFEEVYPDWQGKRLTQAGEEGLDGLLGKRLEQVSHRRAPVDEGVKLMELYRRDYAGWNVRHFHGYAHKAVPSPMSVQIQ